MVVNIIGNIIVVRVNCFQYYCCTRELFYAKMLKETENKETWLFRHNFIFGGILIKRGGTGPPRPWLREWL